MQLFVAMQAADVLTTIVGLSMGGREVGLAGQSLTTTWAGYVIKMAIALLIVGRVGDRVKLRAISPVMAEKFMLGAVLVSAIGPVWNSIQLLLSIK